MKQRSMPLAFGLATALALVACGPRFARTDGLAVGTTAPSPSSSAPAVPTTQPSFDPGDPGVAPTSRTVTRIIKGTGRVVTGGVVKVGGLFPLSGGLSALGKPAWQGADAYFRWLNDHGGVGGKKIQFISCDDQASDTQSTTCAKKLVEQDGVFIMGPSFTPFSFTVIKQLADGGVPWVGYDGINVEGFDAENVVTVGAPIDSMAHAILPYWYDKVKRETGTAPAKIGAVVLDTAPAVSYVREAKNVICPRLGCQIVRDQRVSYTTTDYATICRNMQNQRVDAIWVITDPASAIKLMVQCQNIGYKPPRGFLGQHGIYMALTLNQVGPFADGMLANGALLPEAVSSPATAEMKKIIRTYHPDADLGYFTALSYASARMVADLVGDVLASKAELSRENLLAEAARQGSYACNGLCKAVNLRPPAGATGGNHNVWIVRAAFSGGKGRWVYEAGPIDVFREKTWPCPGRPRPC